MDNTADLALPGLIHDLNNVFQTLMEAADLLADDPQWAPVSAAILRSLERGREITMSMQSMEQPVVALETILANARSLVEDSFISGRGPKIQFACDVQPGLILHRAWAWERVLVNLFCNAVRAMPHGGNIFVTARREKDRIRITVADEGLGIDPSLLPTIFDPHVTTKQATGKQATGKQNGGLGLHIVQTIVRQSEGEVYAANRQGRGAEFVISIPVEPVLTRSASA
jgi:signal transduction histidine kinase